MHIAVTGACGLLGRHAVPTLLAAGHTVHAIDRVRPARLLCPFQTAEIRDLGQVCGALAGCDAVLHLAALPSPIGHPPEEVFSINALGTFNILEAARLLGIRQVVTISSASALGVAYATHRPVSLRYVPVDEDHEVIPQDAYGLSKVVGEEICRTFHRRTGGTAISLRFPLIWDQEAAPDQLAHLAQDEVRAMHTLWSYITVSDAARACLAALQTPNVGAPVFYVAAPESFMRKPSAELARTYFPNLEEIKGSADGHWSFHDCRRAAEVLGFTAAPIFPYNT